MAIEAVKEFFAEYGRENEICEFDVSSATVDLAAEALGVEGALIAKSIALYENAAKESVILLVVAGDARIDNKKFRDSFGYKPKFCKPDDTLKATGHAVGGVCPFALRTPVPVYLDASLKRFENVYPACGSSNSAIKLNLEELANFASAKDWVDVCNSWS